MSVTSTRGKLVELQRHYQQLGKLSLDSNFDAEWKEEVESNVSRYGSMSELCFLDNEIEKGEIVKCIKNNKTGGSDGLVGELVMYGGSGMVYLLEQLFSVIWSTRRLSLSNGERALYLRKVIGRIQVIIEVLPYLVL